MFMTLQFLPFATGLQDIPLWNYVRYRLEDNISTKVTLANNYSVPITFLFMNFQPHLLSTDMGHNSTAYLHHSIEAIRLGFADALAHVSDMAHSSVPVDQMLSQSYADSRRMLIRSDRSGSL